MSEDLPERQERVGLLRCLYHHRLTTAAHPLGFNSAPFNQKKPWKNKLPFFLRYDRETWGDIKACESRKPRPSAGEMPRSC